MHVEYGTYAGCALYKEAELEASALLSSSGVLSGSSGICPRIYPKKKTTARMEKLQIKKHPIHFDLLLAPST